MSELKKGDIAELKSGIYKSFYKGDKLEFVSDNGDTATLNHKIEVSKDLFKKVEDSKMYYETSNRKKLHDYIKATGHTSVALGEAMGNKWHFSNVTKKSRFEGRGDIDIQSLEYFKKLVDNCICNIESSRAVEKYSKKPNDKVNETQNAIVNNTVIYEKKSNWMKLNKITFGICLIFIILLISFLYFVVSK